MNYQSTKLLMDHQLQQIFMGKVQIQQKTEEKDCVDFPGNADKHLRHILPL